EADLVRGVGGLLDRELRAVRAAQLLDEALAGEAGEVEVLLRRPHGLRVPVHVQGVDRERRSLDRESGAVLAAELVDQALAGERLEVEVGRRGEDRLL